MPIPLPEPQPTLVSVVELAGGHLGVVALRVDGHLLEAPVAWGAYRVPPDWSRVVQEAVAHRLGVGACIAILPSLHGLGPAGELPVVEVVIGPDGDTLGSWLVRQGWALPDAQVLGTDYQQPIARAYLAALTDARSHHAGLWAEAGTPAAAGLDPELAARSQTVRSGAIGWEFVGLVLLALVLLALRGSAPVLPGSRPAAQRPLWRRIAWWYLQGTLPTPLPRSPAGPG